MSLRCTRWWSVNTIKLLTHPSPHLATVCVVRALQICPLRTRQVYNMVLLTSDHTYTTPRTSHPAQWLGHRALLGPIAAAVWAVSKPSWGPRVTFLQVPTAVLWPRSFPWKTGMCLISKHMEPEFICTYANFVNYIKIF